MKCKHCKSSWNSSIAMSLCPFCGNSILKEITENMTFTKALKTIIEDNGIAVLLNSRFLHSILADCVVGYNKEKKLLKIASDNGVLTSIIKISQETNPEQQQVLVQKTKKILTDDAFLSEENAVFILNILLDAIGIKYDENVIFKDKGAVIDFLYRLQENKNDNSAITTGHHIDLKDFTNSYFNIGKSKKEYRVHEVAKDFNLKSKVILETLDDFYLDERRHMDALKNWELDILFEIITQKNMVDDFKDYFTNT